MRRYACGINFYPNTADFNFDFTVKNWNLHHFIYTLHLLFTPTVSIETNRGKSWFYWFFYGTKSKNLWGSSRSRTHGTEKINASNKSIDQPWRNFSGQNYRIIPENRAIASFPPLTPPGGPRWSPIIKWSRLVRSFVSLAAINYYLILGGGLFARPTPRKLRLNGARDTFLALYH